MVKLNKMQAQAIISKLGREYNIQRTRLIEEEEKNYVPSPETKKFAALLKERDEFKGKYEEASSMAKAYAEELGLTTYYNYDSAKSALDKLKDKEIHSKYAKIDLDAALDDLIIESVEDDFNVDSFIEHYIKRMKNG